MANKRMFSIDVVCTDKFLEMPSSSQALYFQFGMNADDEGFVSAPKQITRMANASDDDLRILISKGYVIPFESGIVVIKHWNVNNYLRKDRLKTTVHKKEKALLNIEDNEYIPAINKNAFLLETIDCDNQQSTSCQPTADHATVNRSTQCRIDKNSIDKKKIYSVHFEEFWKIYPRKREKAKAYKAYNARLNDGFSEKDILEAGKSYAKECEEKNIEERYIKHGATFLSVNTPFIDYLSAGKEQENESGNKGRRQTADSYRELLR